MRRKNTPALELVAVLLAVSVVLSQPAAPALLDLLGRA